jgi:signal transduction histidine kinase
MDGAISGAVEPPRVSQRVIATRAGRILLMIAAGGLYYAAAKLGYLLEFAGPVAAIVWLPVGVAVSFLYLGGLGLWPGVLVADLAVNDYAELPLGAALGQTAGNMLEVFVITLLLRRIAQRGSPLDSVGGLFLMVGAIAVGTVVSATIGPLSLLAGDVVQSSNFFDVWRTWWLGDATGALVVVPLALAWWPLPRHVDVRGRLPEGVLMFATVVVLSEIGSRSSTPLTYLVFPVLIWAGLRFGQRGASLAVATTAGIFIWNTTHYSGPFHFDSITRSVLNTQLYIAVAALSTLCIAAVVSEREAYAERLGASRARLFKAAETERRRIERNLHDGAQQRLVALAVNLGLAAERTRDAPEEARAAFSEAQAELQVAVDELRELAHGMHPSVLRNLGLANAIRALAAQSTIPATVVEVPAERADDTAEATAYYVVSEAMANTHRHAGASAVSIRASFERDRLLVEVADDGVGGAVASRGSGLEGLHERVEAAGGSLAVVSPIGHGTRVTATIPATRR